MRKISFFVFSVFVFLFFFSFCEKKITSSFPKKDLKVEQQETRGVFLSYIELKKYLNGKSEEESKKNIQKIIATMKENSFNLLILQVRSFSDAIYPSTLFPSSKVVGSKEGDPLLYDYLEYFLETAHHEGILVHAWVNLYRVSSSLDTSVISTRNPAYRLLGSEHTEVVPEKGVYYNPASEKVKTIILKGIEELVQNYDIDGIHFDDYFYPSDTIDLVSYEKSGKTMSLADFRMSHINDLVRRAYKIVHQKKNLPLGISPQGNIDNNYKIEYADVKRWAREEGYVDYLMPQVYYGFFNEVKPYYQVVKEWEKIVTNPKVSLYFTLALYKTGVIDVFAKSGANEWVEENDILKKEVLIARGISKYKGFSLFRYDYLVDSTLQAENTIAEIKNLKEILT